MLRLPVSMYYQLRRGLLRNNTDQTAIEHERMLRNDKVGLSSDRWKSAENSGSLAVIEYCNVAKE